MLFRASPQHFITGPQFDFRFLLVNHHIKNALSMAIALQNLLKNSVRFGHFQFYAGQFDGLNQSVLLTGLQKANKKFQPNLGSGQT